MGHPEKLDDWIGVQAVAATLIRSARGFVFPGEVEWRRELPDCTVRARSFDAYFRLQHDPLNWRTQNPVDWRPEESRTMLVIRFAPADQPLADEPWSLRVRGEWPTRRDRLPDDSPFSSKSLRTGRGWKHRKMSRRVADRRLPKVPWGRHDSLWIAEVKGRQAADNQFSDLEAQVGLFLLQTGSVLGDGEVRDHVVEYLRQTFSWLGVKDPDADVHLVYGHLLKHKWWLDDRRAWRKYVRACINGLAKSQRHRAARVPHASPDEEGRLTVDQFARAHGISRSSVYDWIRNGTLPAVKRKKDRRYMISADAVSQVRRPGISRPQRADLIRVLVNHGRSQEAARKWVSRQERSGLSFVAIAAKIMKVKPHN